MGYASHQVMGNGLWVRGKKRQVPCLVPITYLTYNLLKLSWHQFVYENAISHSS